MLLLNRILSQNGDKLEVRHAMRCIICMKSGRVSSLNYTPLWNKIGFKYAVKFTESDVVYLNEFYTFYNFNNTGCLVQM